MSGKGRGGTGDRPLGVLTPRYVPLSAEHQRQAVDALANLLAPLLAACAARSDDAADAKLNTQPDDDRAA